MTRLKFRVIRTILKGNLVLDECVDPDLLTLRVAVDRRRRPASQDNEHWWVRSIELTPRAAATLRDQLDRWIRRRA